MSNKSLPAAEQLIDAVLATPSPNPDTDTSGVVSNPASERAPIVYEKTVEYIYLQRFGLTTIAPLDGDLEILGDAVSECIGKWAVIEFKRTEKERNDELDKFVPMRLRLAERAAKLEYEAERAIFAKASNRKSSSRTVGEFVLLDELVANVKRAKTAYEQARKARKDMKKACRSTTLSTFLNGISLINDGAQKTADGDRREPHFLIYSDVRGKAGDWKVELKAERYLGAWLGGKYQPEQVKEVRTLGWPFNDFKDYVRLVIDAKGGDASDGGVLDDLDSALAVNSQLGVAMSVSDFVQTFKFPPVLTLREQREQRARETAKRESDLLKQEMDDKGRAANNEITSPQRETTKFKHGG